MVAFCPRCGAEFAVEPAGEWLRTSLRCSDCRLALTEIPPILAPSDDEIGYDLAGWPVTVRAPATAALLEIGIPYRWETGLVLVVPAAVEETVDRLIEDLEADEIFHTTRVTEVEDEGGREEAQAAMADLFVAADRFQHAPFDDRAIVDMSETAARVASCFPPYGIDRQVWSRIQALASTIASGLDKAQDFDAVAADARELRDFLRDYV